MAKNTAIYSSPLVERNASKEMAELFGADKKFSTWRRLWLELAKAEKKLGLNITDAQIKQMQKHLDDIDYKKAADYEKKFRHDVMAHVHTFADAAPKAAPIIHLGATSCDIGDNADLIIMREGLRILAGKLAALIDRLGRFAKQYRTLPTLGFTHYQPAQLTTVGKRATLWCADFAMDLAELEYRIEQLPFRGIKGTTGTQASFLALFSGSHAKVKKLDETVARAFGFTNCCAVTGQTYPRKIDKQIVDALASIAQSAHKMCNDIRLLANLKEIEEPFEKSQIGSSAMAYKRNPMRCERATGLARLVLSLAASPAMTAAEQWLERTLDDSSNRRVAIAEAFLAADGILEIMLNVASGLVVYPKVIASHVAAELPFMATENILMAGVKAGGNRQELHERIRIHSHAAAAQVKQYGLPNDLIERLQNDPAFAKVDFKKVMNPNDYIGRAPQQVDEFLAGVVAPIRRKYRNALNKKTELKV
ncbi:MAG TPA: adenylosuccinate lyase [Anaerohalosphaeraceae bacterium]|nr:adenylosuccinate lyase [Phycisphaerae bacterium]HOK94492.1 adenylosuccinate lyase [Anaerohalosphaeraceae bacterium]HOL31435.1 adenylosuccinate lyase [Anaerohalosphaeraceae bacterium]HOM76348.1 adenylosuccinate lyase [Anaerohalosphaeraceae bacterium]HPC63293.1 adenylosuccinate lyase [Anaerohalosphaeraceae bacterium]